MTRQNNDKCTVSGGRAGCALLTVKIHYTFDTDHQVACLTRSRGTSRVCTDASLGTVEIARCVNTVIQSSPELVASPWGLDYAVYSVDVAEDTKPLVGHGLLSALLSGQSARDPLSTNDCHCLVSGHVVPRLKLLSAPSCAPAFDLQVTLRFVPLACTANTPKYDLPPSSPPATDPLSSLDSYPWLSSSTSISDSFFASEPDPAVAKPHKKPSPSSQQRKAQIEKSLAEAIKAGMVPEYCDNCGAVRTPTWRRVKYKDKAHTLCNPCGLWLANKKTMRPSSLWNNNRGRRSKSSPKGPEPLAEHNAHKASHKRAHDDNSQSNAKTATCLFADTTFADVFSSSFLSDLDSSPFSDSFLNIPLANEMLPTDGKENQPPVRVRKSRDPDKEDLSALFESPNKHATPPNKRAKLNSSLPSSPPSLMLPTNLNGYPVWDIIRQGPLPSSQ